MTAPTQLNPKDVADLLAKGQAVLFDVRDPDEFARRHVKGARLRPLASLESAPLDVPAGALTDDRFCPAAFAAHGVRILNPAIVFGLIYLARKTAHYKKKDLYCLNRRVPRERKAEIAAANPRLRDDPDFLDWKYSYGAWLKDELFGISPPARRARP